MDNLQSSDIMLPQEIECRPTILKRGFPHKLLHVGKTPEMLTRRKRNELVSTVWWDYENKGKCRTIPFQYLIILIIFIHI